MRWLKWIKQHINRNPGAGAPTELEYGGSVSKNEGLDSGMTLLLEGHEKRFFEQALKLYIFSRHVASRHISMELSEQLSYCANVVYSLIINWLRDGRPSIEYLEFLNTRIAALRDLPETHLAGLEIRPHEINAIELMQRVPLQFTDADTGAVCRLEYFPDEGLCRFVIDSVPNR